MAKTKLPELEQNRLSIVYRKLSSIKLLPEDLNPKIHAEPQIMASLREFGMIDPIAINGTTAHDFDGNGRAKMLQKMKDAGESPPKYCYLSEDEKDWFVPTLDGVFMDSFTEARAALALNRSNQLGIYNEPQLLTLLQNIAENSGKDSLAATGYSIEDMNALLMKAALENEKGKSSGNQSGGTQTAKSESQFAASHVRMMQLFLNAETQPLFVARTDALIRTGKFIFREQPVANLTDLIFALVEKEAAAQNIVIEGTEK